MRFRTVFHRVPATIVLVAFAFVSTIAAEAEKNQSQSVAIKNFGRINDGYYRGAQPENEDYDNLAKLGIKAVINLTSDDADPNEKVMVEKAGMQYHQIPMTTHIPPTPAKLMQFLKIVNDPSNQAVFVHCVGGKHRTGVMTAIYRMTQHGWNADQAYEEMKQFKFGASFLHPEFKRFVFDYYKQIVSAPAQAVAAPATSAAAN